MVGNLSTFLIFYFLRSNPKERLEADDKSFLNDTLSFFDQTTKKTTARSNDAINRALSNCGLNDCQDPNITSNTIEQYVPQNPIVIYVLIGCFVLLMLSGIFLHVCIMAEIPLDILNNKEKNLTADNNNYINSPEELHNLSNESNATKRKSDDKKKKSLKEVR